MNEDFAENSGVFSEEYVVGEPTGKGAWPVMMHEPCGQPMYTIEPGVAMSKLINAMGDHSLYCVA